ncbi:hypothetical protein HPP92_011005 [Vanilla planifolia]|uniref:Stomatal closure-related actin-binding protein 1 n=1 Tax=Vanilla planifolia TaxID=51239 RepID=A0A835V4L6_VANPL|nr:hypothetical protein HPP92_011005 [Vanilla planifolia]
MGSIGLAEETQKGEGFVSARANAVSNEYPKYTIGPGDDVFETMEATVPASLKEVIARETAQLIEQQKRLSVRDLAKKFEIGLHAVAKLSEESKWKEIATLDKHIILGKLRDLLESLRGRVAGRNKEDVDEAVSMVEALAVQLTQREGEIHHEKAEVKRLAILMKQASEDAKRVVEEERSIARAEIERAKEAVKRVEKALKEQECSPKGAEPKVLEELMKEVHEARRIKMLHQPSRVKDMQHELHALRTQLEEKSLQCIRLRKELDMNRRIEENKSNFYKLEGSETLGSSLHIVPLIDSWNISTCTIQWYRILPEESERELISGAIGPNYSPEPFDVGHFLVAEVSFENGEKVAVTTTGPINSAVELGTFVDALVRKKEAEFNVVVLHTSGSNHPSQPDHVLFVGKSRIKLQKGRTTKARETYSPSMQICGLRGCHDSAARSLFWKARQDLSFSLAFESEVERNAAIMLAQRFASESNVILGRPDNPGSLEE